ncbi:MAG: response regulator [Desulfuromonadales bacterium]
MSGESTRVLVVEDDRDFAESLVIALGTRNCQVEIAYTGEDAIRIFHDRAFDIVFMDIKLPGKNGVQSLAEILDFAPQARIVMMTGFSEPSLLEQARRAGALDVLRKPFRMRDLLGFIDRLQDGAREGAATPRVTH